MFLLLLILSVWQVLARNIHVEWNYAMTPVLFANLGDVLELSFPEIHNVYFGGDGLCMGGSLICDNHQGSESQCRIPLTSVGDLFLYSNVPDNQCDLKTRVVVAASSRIYTKFPTRPRTKFPSKKGKTSWPTTHFPTTIPSLQQSDDDIYSPYVQPCQGGSFWNECASLCGPNVCGRAPDLCAAECEAKCDCPVHKPWLKEGICVEAC